MSAVERLQKLIDEIDVLIDEQVTINSASFKSWFNLIEIFLKNNFGNENAWLTSIYGLHFAPVGYNVDMKNFEEIYACKQDLEQAKHILLYCLEDLQEKEEIKKQENNFMSSQKETELSYQKVFIVHGHDGELKHRVARLIEKQGIEAIILDEQVNSGRTIIEKFEENSDVGGAICLFTADDMGKKKWEAGEEKYSPRPRQNVVFEAGYFMGKLGRNHVVIISESGVELPSDMSGIVYTNTQNWELDVLKELKVMGYSIDMNKLL